MDVSGIEGAAISGSQEPICRHFKKATSCTMRREIEWVLAIRGVGAAEEDAMWLPDR